MTSNHKLFGREDTAGETTRAAEAAIVFTTKWQRCQPHKTTHSDKERTFYRTVLYITVYNTPSVK